MASIQGRLPDGLEALRDCFSDRVTLRIVDRRNATLVEELRGWEHLPQLRSEGTYEHIKRHLTEIVEREYHAGTLHRAAYDQALGLPPQRFYRGVDTGRDQAIERNRAREDPASEGLVKRARERDFGPEL